MAESTSFKSLCGQVTKEISEKAKLSTDIENIIEQKDISTIPKLIQNKTFTSTSNSELAAIFIKTMIYYIDKKYSSDADKNKKLLKYIKLLQAKKLDLFTVKKICLEKFTNFYYLIEHRYNGISKKAKTILNNLKFDSDESEKEKMEKINKQISNAKGGFLTLPQLDTLSKVFEKIKNVCKRSYCDDSIFNKDILETILSQCLSSESRISKSIFNKSKSYKAPDGLHKEFEYLKKVIKQDYKGIDEILKQCHRDAVRKLLTAKRRIENAYKDFIPPKPSHPPPSVPTDDISDDPPPLRPVKKRQRHTPPADPPPKPPRRVNSNATSTATTEQKSTKTYKPLPMPPRRANSKATPTATTEQKITKTHKKNKQGHTPPTYQPPPAPKGKNGTAKTPLEQHKRNLRAQRKNRLPLATPPKLEVPTGGPPQ